MPVKLALLGSGLFVKLAYLPVLLNNDEVDLVAVWSRSKSSAENIALEAKKSGTEIRVNHGEDGLEQLLNDQDIEAVIMALPITTQPRLVSRILASGKHLLSEKPVHKDVTGALGLIEEYERTYEPKGLHWRVAENYAHEPLFLKAGDLVRDPAFGPILYWHIHQEFAVPDGSMWQATEWRTIPDYPGGNILDGGVHMAALLRVVLPNPPTRVFSTVTQHRAHLPPADTVMAIALSPRSTYVPPHGRPTRLRPVEVTRASHQGESGTQGTIFLTWACPETPNDQSAPNWHMEITGLNGKVRIEAHYSAMQIVLTLSAASDSQLTSALWEGPLSGVAEEVLQFVRAIGGSKDKNRGNPRDALRDLAFVEAMLASGEKGVIELA